MNYTHGPAEDHGTSGDIATLHYRAVGMECDNGVAVGATHMNPPGPNLNFVQPELG
jgi:hypothetical protein